LLPTLLHAAARFVVNCLLDNQRCVIGRNDNRMAEPYILVVEDDRPVQQILVRWLENLGYATRAVETADAAIAAIMRERPYAVISDVVMPVHDGLWLLEQIRARWTSLPVIMSSGAWLEEAQMIKARRLGAVDFIAKPFIQEQLAQALKRVN
jgi:CheY-like chemotaxis protein